jgi:HAE1 family hydrophobic/amphiphilic exporter-1
MNVTERFIRRPVVTILVMLGILLFGVVGYRFLPLIELRDVYSSIIVVTAGLPGASPETMESSVAAPLERQLSTIAGLNTMTSVNDVGSTEITLQFSPSRNIDAAAQDVQAAIARTLSQLPNNMSNLPSYRKINRADLAILYLFSTVDKSVETAINQSGAA